MAKRALITGITGQDGSYLAELLLNKGYEVHGIIRRSSNFNTQRIDHLYKDPHSEDNMLHLHYGDLTDGVLLTNLIREIEPNEVYNLGAQSHVMVSFSVPEYTAQVDGVGTIRMLEAIRSSKLDCRYYQASTSELFGSTPPPQSEKSLYREAYGLHATNGILFNHESPRRGETFVTRKITRAVAKIKLGRQEKLYLGNLSAIRDWGYAPEYVESMWMMLQQDSPDDYVVATGIGATVENFVERAFTRVGLDWKQYVEVDNRYQRPTEVEALIGDPSYIRKKLGWVAKTHWGELAELMVDADLEILKKN